MATNPNASAYPLTENILLGNNGTVHDGLTKREYFAAMAMQGLCLDGAYSTKIQEQCEKINTTTSIAIATYAVDLADALIAELNREGGVK